MKLVKIEHLEETKDVYDFSVSNGHEYVANGIATHNSSLAIQLLKNFCDNSESCLYVPLEMTEKESTARLLSNLSKVPISNILQKKMSKSEKLKIKKAAKEFHKKLHKQKNSYSILSPEQDMSAEEILLMTHPYDYRVILIDYISLLKDVDGEDQWRQLAAVARLCKVYAKTHNKIVVLLVQVNDDGYIRYSKGVEEHANNAFYFVANKETREAGLLNITQKKARNQAMFDFQLAFQPETMTITDVSDSPIEENNELSDASEE